MSLEIDSITLINAVKKRIELYNRNSKGYNDRNLKKKLWIEVCKEVFTPTVWESLPKHIQGRYEIEVHKKWEGFRHCFRRELIKQNTLPSGGAVSKKRKKYVYFDHLLFLLPFVSKIDKEWSISYNEGERNDIALKVNANTLIPEVKKRPPLYDSSIPEFSDRDLKKNLWIEVCQNIFTTTVWESLSEKEKEEHVYEVQKKWQNLRHCFRRGLNAKNKQKYLHYDQLEFLLPCSKIGKAQCEHENISSESNSSGDSSAEMSDNYEEVEMITLPPEENQNENPKELDNGHQNDDELFLRSLIPYMKDIPGDKKLELRMEIIKLILNFKESLNKNSSVLNNFYMMSSVKIEPITE